MKHTNTHLTGQMKLGDDYFRLIIKLAVQMSKVMYLNQHNFIQRSLIVVLFTEVENNLFEELSGSVYIITSLLIWET